MLFNEPKLLKFGIYATDSASAFFGFSALQRAEIAEIQYVVDEGGLRIGFSALQRAEIAEIDTEAGLSTGLREFQCSSTSRNC